MKFYTKSGMWLEEVAPHTIVIGMSPKGQDDIGEVAFFEFLEDESIVEDQPFIAIEGEKAVSEIPAPLSGKIIEKNDQLVENPELLSSTDDAATWMLEVHTDAFDANKFLTEG